MCRMTHSERACRCVMAIRRLGYLIAVAEEERHFGGAAARLQRSDRCAKAPKRLAPSRPREAVDDTDGRQSGGAQRGRTASRPGRDTLPTRVAGRSSSRCGTSSSALCTSTSCCRPWSARSTRSSVPQGLSRSLVLRIKSIRKCATPSARVGTGAGPVRFRDGSRCRPRSRRCPSAPSAAGRSSPSSSPAIS